MPTDEEKRAYREAYAAWQQQLERLHAFLLDGERPGGPRAGPDVIKGLFNREARAKERYDEARRRLIGIDG